MKDDNITEAAIEEIAAILAAGYLRYRLEQFSAKSTAVRVDTSVSSSPHGVEVALHLLDLLQWGRDQTIAEIQGDKEEGKAAVAASMGPRSDDRGNGSRMFHAQGRVAASMGPRSDDRGNKSAEITGRGIVGLQWGRDQTIAEMAMRTLTNSPSRCFNGAAIRRSRKSEADRHRSHIGPGFNGAAIRRSRKCDVGVEATRGGGASMGPRSDDRGNQEPTPEPGRQPALQWGRDQTIAEMRTCADWRNC